MNNNRRRYFFCFGYYGVNEGARRCVDFGRCARDSRHDDGFLDSPVTSAYHNFNLLDQFEDFWRELKKLKNNREPFHAGKLTTIAQVLFCYAGKFLIQRFNDRRTRLTRDCEMGSFFVYGTMTATIEF